MIHTFFLLLLNFNSCKGFLPSSPWIPRKSLTTTVPVDIRSRGSKKICNTPLKTSGDTHQSHSTNEQHEPLVVDKEHSNIYCKALGGEIRRIELENDSDGFLTKLSVPTFATFHLEHSILGNDHDVDDNQKVGIVNPKRKSLEGLIPGAFLVDGAIHPNDCESIIDACERIGFGKFNVGKNNHGAMQILVTEQAAQVMGSHIFKHLDMDSVNQISSTLYKSLIKQEEEEGIEEGVEQEEDVEYQVVGLNQRWRVYRYDPGGEEKFAPHIDAGFPPSTLSNDGTTLIWDATSPQNQEVQKVYAKDTVSRLTVLMYLNDDFEGGHTKFYEPMVDSKGKLEVLASVKPKTGSILVFPQAVGEEAVEYARQHWPLHEGSPVFNGGRPKYVIRSDVLFIKAREGLSREEKLDPLWRNDEYVRSTFLPQSDVLSSKFLSQLKSLYNPHMGVENVGQLLYSMVRFTKARRIVEIGAGFTTLWLLQALKDNDDEMNRVKLLNDKGKCTLLDIPWTVNEVVDDYNSKKSSLLCIDNCLHQRETATGAGAVAKSLGVSEYLEFVKGDAFDMNFEPETIDLLWCDFGVGSRMKDFARGAWRAIRQGGLLVCHSTITNSRTREWLEAIRRRAGEEETGIPNDEFVELSFLEPHKRYQNSITILQRRKCNSNDKPYTEPIYSEYA